MTDKDYLWLAYQFAAEFSDDPATENGAVLVTADEDMIVKGTNRLPEGVDYQTQRLERPEKYAFIEHAERDAILLCANKGIRTRGATLYVPWYACADCARAIIVAGIKRVVGHKQMFDKTPERWRESIAKGDAMLDEAGVIREQIDGRICDGPRGEIKVKFNGEVWVP